MRFEHPEWIWLSVAAAALGLALVYAWRRRRRSALGALGSAGMLERLTRADLSGAPVRRAALVGSCLGFIGLAVAGPQWGAERVEEETRGLNIVLAIDISESMRAEDVAPNRFERARVEARRLVNELAGHRIGVLAFAGAAYLLSPLTVDHGAIHLYLDALDPTVGGTPGSAMAAGVRRATEVLAGASASSELSSGDLAVVMLTDGEAHDPNDEVKAAAREADAAGVRLYVVAIGREDGEPIPRYDRAGNRLSGFKRDREGAVVLSRMTREPLDDAAVRTGGFWTPAEGGGTNRVLDALAELRAGAGRTTRGVRWIPRFQWFIGVALVLLMADWAWAWRSVR